MVATCFIANTQLPAGTYSVTATYWGTPTTWDRRPARPSDLRSKGLEHDEGLESSTSAALGSENLVTFSATVTSGNGEKVATGDAVTLHVGSASCNATTNASGVASCSIGASALVGGSLQRFGEF